MTSFILRLLDFLSRPLSSTGIDYPQVRAIVEVKLMMDGRRHVIGNQQKNHKEPRNKLIGTFIIYLLFGGLIGLMLLYYPSFNLSMLIFFSYIMMMITMTLITDFSSVLLDTSDNTIILPRPVDSQTLFMARLIHILVYLGQLTVGLTLIPMIIVVWKYQAFVALFFFISILMSVLIAMALTNALYLLIMQFTSEEKLRNIINALQIVMTILLVGGYQLGPRMLSRLENQNFDIHVWSLLAPPVWMTGLMEAVQYDFWDGLHIASSFFAIAIPCTSVLIVHKYLTPVFNRRISSLETTTRATATMQNQTGSLVSKLSKWVTTSTAERSAFELIYRLLGRDRKIKLKIYPSYGYVIVFALVFLVSGSHNFNTTLSELPETRYHIFLLYLVFMVLQVAMHEVSFSDDYKASWIYFSAPIEKPGDILAGALKAIFTKLFLPGYALLSMGIIILWGSSVIPDVVFGFFNNMLMLVALAMIHTRHIPFSMAPDVRAQSGTFARSIVAILVSGCLGFGHYLLSPYPMILIILIPLQILIVWLLLRSYQSTRWVEIRI